MQTFTLPGAAQVEVAREMISAWRRDGIFQIQMTTEQHRAAQRAYRASRWFFAQSLEFKARHVSSTNYGGYVRSGEEMTAGIQDASEIYTVCRDIPSRDERCLAGWPCHGPMPWPSQEYEAAMQGFMAVLGQTGERLLELVALGLNLPVNALTDLTREGWHHARILRFPAKQPGGGDRGIGAHTDYGLLVIASQDDVGGLWIRPPVPGEHRPCNWRFEESMAGMYEDQEPWTFVKPVPDVLTCFPGDILQFISNGLLLSTPHKVKQADRERFALAYFHEPNFSATARCLVDPSQETIHYGRHFTNMFMRCYPDRITTQRIRAEGRLKVLEKLR